MKVRDVLLAVVATAFIYLVIFAPLGVGQVPAEAPYITIDINAFPEEQRPALRNLQTQLNRAFQEGFMTTRKCCPTDSL